MNELAEVPGRRDRGVGQPPAQAPAAGDGLRWGVVVLVTVVLCALPALLIGGRIDDWTGRVLSRAVGAPAVAGLVVGLLALDTVLPVPSSVLATIAGRRFGFVGGAAAICAGLCLGNALGYLLGRLAGAPLVERVVGGDQLARARARVTTRPGTTALLVSRPVPVLSEAAVVLAGAARAPVARMALVCGPANVGLAAVYAGLGSGAHGVWTVPLGVAGAVGVPALALAGSVLLHGRRPPAGASGRRRSRPTDP
jgi:uncharacterized membrane protein YdjX (TVP38/TMEM64 family)